MGKGQKVFTMTEQDMSRMVEKAAEAGVKAYKKEHEASAKSKVDRMLYRTRVLLEKYRYLKEYSDKAVYTLEKAEEVDNEIADIDVLTKFGIFDDDKTLHRMKRGVITVRMIMAHVDTMLDVYRAECETSANPTRQRRWRVIYGMYLAEDRLTTKEIADQEGEEIRTIQNDAKAAREDLTALIFGIDGILIRILRDNA